VSRAGVSQESPLASKHTVNALQLKYFWLGLMKYKTISSSEVIINYNTAYE
jgi:hypothetical protein